MQKDLVISVNTPILTRDFSSGAVLVTGSALSLVVEGILHETPAALAITESMWAPIVSISAAGVHVLPLVPSLLRVRYIGGTVNFIGLRVSDAPILSTTATSSGGTGDIEGVTAGDGLTGGGTSGTVALAINYEAPNLHEKIRDVVAAFLQQGGIITVSHNDAGDTFTISATAVSVDKTAYLYHTTQDTLTATSDGQTVFTASIDSATRRVALVKVGGEVYGPANFTHVGTVLTLTGSLTAPIDAQVVLIYRGDA